MRNGNNRRRIKETICRRNIAAIITTNFPRPVTYTKPQTQEAQRTPSMKIPKYIHPGINYSNGTKLKQGEKPLRNSKEKNHLTYRRTRKKITVDLSSKITEARRVK